MLTTTRRVSRLFPISLSLLLGLALNGVPSLTLAQQPAKPSGNQPPPLATRSLSPVEEERVRATIEQTTALARTLSKPTEVERWDALLDEAFSGNIVPPSSRTAFVQQFQSLKPVLRTARDRIVARARAIQQLNLPPPPNEPRSYFNDSLPSIRLAAWVIQPSWTSQKIRPLARRTASGPGNDIANVTSTGTGQHQITYTNGDRATITDTGGGTRTEGSIPDVDGGTIAVETWSTTEDQVASDHVAFEMTIKKGVQSAASQTSHGMKDLASVARCPTADGLVPGKADFSIFLSGITAGQGGSIRFRETSESTGQVAEDARLTEVTVNIDILFEQQTITGNTGSETITVQAGGTLTFDPHGSETPPIPVTRCTVNGSQLSSGLCQDLFKGNALPAIIDELRKTYVKAEKRWNLEGEDSRECVKLHFTPPTKTEEVPPGQSVDVKAEIRTVKGDQPTWGRLSEIEDYRGGHASPASVGTAPRTPAVFRFVAPSDVGDPNDPPGFYVNKGTSRAGRIKSKNLWQMAAPSLVLEFDSMIVGTVQYGKSHARAVVPLRYTRERGYAGQGPLYYETVPSLMTPCIVIVEGKGVTTFNVTAGVPQQRNGAVVDYELFIRPGDTDEIGRVTPCKGPPPPPVPTAFWSGLFNITRFMTFNWQLAGFPVNGWTIVNQGDVLATKTMKTTCNRLCDEVTTMTLRRKSRQTAQPAGSGGP